jgi:Ca-activated chloride channel family protein
MSPRPRWLPCTVVLLILAALVQAGPSMPSVVIPQSRAYGFQASATTAVKVIGVTARIEANQAGVRTTLAIGLENMTTQPRQVQLLIPVPEGVTVRDSVDANMPGRPGACLLSGEAAHQRILDLLAEANDPAPVEFLGYDLIQTEVVTLDGRARLEVCVAYNLPLRLVDNRLDIILPRTESLDYQVPWDITASIDLQRALSTAYSPSHEITLTRESGHRMSVANTPGSRLTPGPFRLTVLVETGDLTGSVFAYPDATFGGGYFLLLLGLPEDLPPGADVVKRELTLVLDHSGSMLGRKVEQAKQAAAQVISSLEDDEAFNLIVYNELVERFSTEPLQKTPENESAAKQFISAITAGGMTDIHAALTEALQQEPIEGMLPLILFLTDGLPTIGQTNEVAIRNLVVQANPYNRRVYTFGVGYDLNAPLLSALASLSMGRSTFILPTQDVDTVMAEVFANLSTPVITDPGVCCQAQDGTSAGNRVLEILPSVLPDVFRNDRLVLLGRYVGQDPLVFKISGSYLNQARGFEVSFDPAAASTENSFVPILWASRAVAASLDEVMRMSAEPGFSLYDPQFMSIALDMVGISIRFGIVTEYTSFLADEDEDLADYAAMLLQTTMELYERSGSRSGMGAVNQSINLNALRGQCVLNPANTYLDRNMRQTQVLNVQHVHDITFYFHQGIWIDSRLVTPGSELPDNAPLRIVPFGSDDYLAIAERLAHQGRQGSLSFAEDVVIPDDGSFAVIQMP